MGRGTQHELDPAMLAEVTRLAKTKDHQQLEELANEKGVHGAVLDEASGRVYRSDAEHLAEGGVHELLEELNPALAELGAGFDSIGAGELDEAVGRTVIADSVAQVIYTAEEAEEQDDLGELATARTFELVNRRLEAAHSPERLYAISGGNDLVAVFLTERLKAAFEDGLDQKDRPYLPESR